MRREIEFFRPRRFFPGSLLWTTRMAQALGVTYQATIGTQRFRNVLDMSPDPSRENVLLSYFIPTFSLRLCRTRHVHTQQIEKAQRFRVARNEEPSCAPVVPVVHARPGSVSWKAGLYTFCKMARRRPETQAADANALKCVTTARNSLYGQQTNQVDAFTSS